jgi:UDP-N-acetylglucosamine 1-carboxyvinyltransferase
MGANIKKIWGNVLEIDGVKELKGVKYKIIPDTNEAGTFLSIAAGIGKNVLIKNVIPKHLDIFLKKMQEMGIGFRKNKDSIEISQSNSFKNIKVQALPYPGFPTDLLPLIVPLLTQAEGKSLIHDPLFENRLNYVHELRKMGADIEIVDPHRAFVFGKTALFGVKIESSDIRAGAALVLAGLMADGKTTIENIEQIDRGYEKIEERLKGLGAEIERG